MAAVYSQGKFKKKI